MRAHYGIAALLAFTACVREPEADSEAVSARLGVIPASENAKWKRVTTATLPDPRFGQAVAVDETRGVLVMFGGLAQDQSTVQSPLADVWEWDPTAGTWRQRASTGTAPEARSAAAVAYDSDRKRFVLFGGRTSSRYDLQDTWEWDPATGEWTDKNGAGPNPSARSQHSMIFDSKTKKVVLFGGGRSELGGDPMNLTITFDDTWEYNGTTWAQRTTSTAPSARAGFGFAYASGTGKAYLFGGSEILAYNGAPTLKQDIWEYDGTAGTWTERTAAGTKPSARFGHTMAFDSSNGMAVVFGGFDVNTNGGKNDVWYWSASSGTWQAHEATTGALWPGKRLWASLVTAGSATHAYLVAGLDSDPPGLRRDGGVLSSPYSTGEPTREIWELNPTTTAWSNRSGAGDSPGARYSHAITADPVTGKIYLFGGTDRMGRALADLWEWNGTKWSECSGDSRPPTRTDSALSYDPVRKSLILFGGNSTGLYTGWDVPLGDTWEWNISTRKWSQLAPAVSPGARSLHAMVTDTDRKKIILYGGRNLDPTSSTDGGVKMPEYELWEWDGATSRWTDRSPLMSTDVSLLGSPVAMVYDEARKKVALFGFNYYGDANASYWEWDPYAGALTTRVITDAINISEVSVVYDSNRRRTIAVGAPTNSIIDSPPLSLCELDSPTSTWYQRTLMEAPVSRRSTGLAFDNQRGVVVLYGGTDHWTGLALDDTWEYRVSGWGPGTGCTAAFAAQCASGNCVDGVCCESASCSGACQSCDVPGKAGMCVLAAAGTQVAGSCTGDQACDGTGACKTSNGKACTSAAECASGFCADGVCCNSACSGQCVSCNQTGRTGICTPFPAGTDPQKECVDGTPPCQFTCDGVGACVYPAGVTCGTCGYCNSSGACQEQWYCSTGTGQGTSTRTSVGTSRDGGPDLATGTVIGTGTGLGTDSGSSSGSKTALTTATATLSQATSVTTGTSTTVPATSTGTNTMTGNSAIATSTTTASGSGSGSKTGTTTATGTSNTATASKTGVSTHVAPDAGAGDSGHAKLGNSGCSCSLGAAPSGGALGPSLLGLLGTLLVLGPRSRKRCRR